MPIKIIAGHCNLEGLTEDNLTETDFCEHMEKCPIKDGNCTKEYSDNCVPARYYDRYKEKKCQI